MWSQTVSVVDMHGGLLGGQVVKVLDCIWSQVLAPLPTGIFLFGAHSAKLRRRVTFMSFRGDIKLSVPGYLVSIGSCLLQALISHHCGKPLRGNKNKYKTRIFVGLVSWQL